MANIQVIPIDIGTAGVEDIAIANAALQVFPKESMWGYSNGDIVIGSTVPARAGSWISRFNLLDIDQPPLVQWVYDPESDNNASVVLENIASKAYLRVCNIDIKPDPKTLFPDIYWEVNGLDLIPRGE
jgi:hypothetical protein